VQKKSSLKYVVVALLSSGPLITLHLQVTSDLGSSALPLLKKTKVQTLRTGMIVLVIHL
jgi:hypothetical protein